MDTTQPNMTSEKLPRQGRKVPTLAEIISNDMGVLSKLTQNLLVNNVNFANDHYFTTYPNTSDFARQVLHSQAATIIDKIEQYRDETAQILDDLVAESAGKSGETPVLESGGALFMSYSESIVRDFDFLAKHVKKVLVDDFSAYEQFEKHPKTRRFVEGQLTPRAYGILGRIAFVREKTVDLVSSVLARLDIQDAVANTHTDAQDHQLQDSKSKSLSPR